MNWDNLKVLNNNNKITSGTNNTFQKSNLHYWDIGCGRGAYGQPRN